eukprot:XP_001692222.1 predicted protein [Chlamydomonas reinhardtii]
MAPKRRRDEAEKAEEEKGGRENSGGARSAFACYNCGCQEMAIKRLGGLKEGQRPLVGQSLQRLLDDLEPRRLRRQRDPCAPPAEADGLRAADQAAAAAMAAGGGGAG